MQTKSTVAMLVHNYRAVLKKCFWANIMGRQEALKSLGSLVNKSALAGLLVAGMTGLAGQIDVNSESGAVAIHSQTSECMATQDMSDPFVQAAADEFCEASAPTLGAVTDGAATLNGNGTSLTLNFTDGNYTSDVEGLEFTGVTDGNLSVIGDHINLVGNFSGSNVDFTLTLQSGKYASVKLLSYTRQTPSDANSIYGTLEPLKNLTLDVQGSASILTTSQENNLLGWTGAGKIKTINANIIFNADTTGTINNLYLTAQSNSDNAFIISGNVMAEIKKGIFIANNSTNMCLAASSKGTKIKGNVTYVLGTIEGDNSVLTFDGQIYGGDGKQISGSQKPSIDGGTSITINSGTYAGSIYGGSFIGTINKGTAITINGGIFSDNIYAGGSGGTVNGGTSVTISGGTFNKAEMIISGKGSGGTVNGDKKLSFAGTLTETQFDNVTFDSFNKIDVAEETVASVKKDFTNTTSLITKTGSGTLVLTTAQAGITGAFVVNDGTLKLVDDGAVGGNVTLGEITAWNADDSIMTANPGIVLNVQGTLELAKATTLTDQSLLLGTLKISDNVTLSGFSLNGGTLAWGETGAIILVGDTTLTSGTIDFTGLGELANNQVIFSGGSEALATSLNTEQVGLTLIGKGDGSFDFKDGNIIYIVSVLSQVELQDYFEATGTSKVTWNVKFIGEKTKLTVGSDTDTDKYFTNGITFATDGDLDLTGKTYDSLTIYEETVTVTNNTALGTITNGITVNANGTLKVQEATFATIVKGSGTVDFLGDASTISGTNFEGFTGTLTSSTGKKLTVDATTINAAITGFSEVEVTGTTTLNSTLEATTLNVTGSLTVNDNFTFANKLSGAGTITNGTFSGNTGSDFSGTASGNLKLTSSQAFANATVNGNVTVSGTGSQIKTLDTGATLTLNLSDAAKAAAVVDVTTLNIASATVKADGLIDGSFALIKSASTIDSFTIQVNGKSISLSDVPSGATSALQYTLRVDGDTLWLNASSTYTDPTGEVVDEFNSAPVVAGQVQQVINTAGMVNNAISEHLTQTIVNPLTINSLTSLTHVDGMQASTEGGVQIITQNIESVGTNVWGQALYSYAEHDGVRKGLDSDENSYGGMIGIERVYQDFSYGAFIGGVSSEVDGDNGYNVESEAIYAGLYTGVRGEVLFANAGVMFGYSFNDTERPGALQDIEGDYDSWMTNVFGEIGAFHHFTENIYGRASVGMQYSYVKAEDYQESEGGNAVDSCDFDSLTVGVDVRLGYRFAQSYLELRAGVTTELLDTEIDSDFRIIDNPGTLYTSQGGELDENKFILGIEGGHRFNDNLEFRAGVLGEFGDSHERYTGNVRLIYSF